MVKPKLLKLIWYKVGNWFHVFFGEILCCNIPIFSVLAKLKKYFHYYLGTNGRLGLSHTNNVSVPRQMSALSQYVVKKVAVHSGGKHAMALTVDGKVFSWGEGRKRLG